MKKIRRLLAILIAITLMLSSVSLEGFAAFSYALDDQGSASVSEELDDESEESGNLDGTAEDIDDTNVPETVDPGNGTIAEEPGLVEQTLEDGSVRLDGLMPEDAEVTAKDASNKKAVKKLEKGNDVTLAAYDITINAEGGEFQPEEDYPIQVQISDKAIKENSDISVWHILDNGKKEQIKDFFVEDGAVIFAASGFSVYVIIEHEGDEAVVTPRVEFHYISEDFVENTDAQSNVLSYTAPAYQFLNKAESGNEKQVSQILTDGESLEKIANPHNKKDSQGLETSFFYGWYLVDMVSDTTTWENGAWAVNDGITYTWHEPQPVSDSTPITIEPVGDPKVGGKVNWTIGDASGQAVLDEEGTAHVYLAPMYEDYFFINFRMGSKSADPGLRNNLLSRRLVVFGQKETTTVRIGDVEGPSPDPAHEIFAGWETIKEEEGELVTDLYYQTLNQDGEEITKTVDLNGNEIASVGTGYYITVKKPESSKHYLDLYPVFAEARWLYYDLGETGNGAQYVPAQYRLTNDDDQGTAFDKLSTTSRPGYDFGGWWTEAGGTGIQLTDNQGNFLDAVKGQTFYGVYVSDGQGGKTLVDISTTQASGAVKIFEITSDGKLYMYKDLDSLTVHAKWTAQRVNYTVVYWLENANDDDYTLLTYVIKEGVAGNQTEAEAVEQAVTTQFYNDNKLRFTHLSEDQNKDVSGTQSGIQQTEIEGDGSTIVNIYYDRDRYTLRFDIGFARRTGNNGSTTVYEQMTKEEASSYTGRVYGYVDGNYVALTPDGNGGYTYQGTVDERQNYDGYRYKSTTGTDTPQYGIANGNVVELSGETAYIYNWQYSNNNNTQWNNANSNVALYLRSGNTYTNSGLTTSSTFTSAPAEGTYYILRNNNSYRNTRTNGVNSTVTSWTYNNGTSYGDNTRYLRVESSSTDNSYNQGFVDGAMKTLLHDSDGWYYNNQSSATVSYSGNLFKQTTLDGTWQFSVSNITGPNYANGNTWDQWLTASRYDLGTSNPFSPEDYTGTYQTEVGGTQYVVYYKEINAKYGENIMDEYPGSQSPKVNGNNTYLFVGWLAQRDSYYNGRLSTSLKGYFETVSEDLILTGGTIPGYNATIPNINPDNYTAVTVDKTYNRNTVTDEYGITQEFRCRYTTLSGAKKYLYEIYLADVDTLQYPSDPTDKFVITGGSGSYPNIQTPPTYYGYSLVDTKLVQSNGNEVTPTANNYSAYAVPELTEAGVGDGMVMVFRFQPNKHKITHKYVNGTAFGPDDEYYYGQSLADADKYTEEAESTASEGHYFVGWFENPDGVGSPFDYNSTMPDGNIVLYAVYQPEKYRVRINPNGAEIDHIDHSGDAYTGSGVAPFNRSANADHPADSGYNKSQSTYFNGVYDELVGEYGVNRQYVPISDTAASVYTEEGGIVYYYVNMQYKTTDGKGLPADLRDALYVTSDGTKGPDDELYQLYLFYHEWATYEANRDPADYTGMTAQTLSYDAWKSMYVQKQEHSDDPQLYRKCNSGENWVFLGWFKDGESTPYNFDDPVREPFTLTAHWRLDGGYIIQYTPEYWLTSEGNTYHINGEVDSWVDPPSGAETLTYTDGAETKIYKQPTDLTKDGSAVTDNSIVFLGWRLVSLHYSTDAQGHEVVSYVPLEDDVYYDPGDEFIVKVDYADKNNVIHMQAVYEETEHSVRRPEIANLTLDANNDFGGDLTIESDTNVEWNSVGTALAEKATKSIKFGDIQSSEPVHLKKYATGNNNYFIHEEGQFLLGFDDGKDEGDYIASYPADSVISVKRTDNKVIYAVWEPLVYLTLVNDTGVGNVSFSLSSENDALEVVNIVEDTYERVKLENLGNITLADGESITLAFPKGTEKDIKISGTNNLGVGKALIWNTSIKLGDNTYDSADGDESYSHTYDGSTHNHSLATGEVNNTKPFEFLETLIANKDPLTVTFTSAPNEYAMVLLDNYPGGGTQEYDYSHEQIATVSGVPKTQLLPNTSTRFGYEFKGWAFSETATEPDYSSTLPEGNPWTVTNLEQFFSTGTTVEDGTKVRRLYAVWALRNEAQHVYIYKDVPLPGNQNQEFTFNVTVSGTYSATGFTPQNISKSGSFTLANGEYADLYSSNSTTDGYIQTVVTLYNADGTRKKNGETEIEPITIKAQATKHPEASFDKTEKIIVTEDPVTYYNTSMTRMNQTNNDIYHYIKLQDNTDRETNPLEDIVGNKLEWHNTDTGGTVIYKNVRETKDISVSKVLKSNTTASRVFSFTASYVDAGVTTNLDNFTVTSGSTNTTALEDIPAGVDLTITEAKDDNYKTTVSVNNGNAVDGKTTTFTVTSDSEVKFTNTLISYPVRFVKVDQDDNTGNVEALFDLINGSNILGTDLLAAKAQGGDGVFYESGEEYQPLYAGETYTLTETFTESGYQGLSSPAKITVSGTEGSEFTFADDNGALSASFDDDDEVWVIKVKNQKTQTITITKTLVDPMVNERDFKFNYSYMPVGGTDEEDKVTGTFTLHPLVHQAASKEIVVPYGVTDFKVTEEQNNTYDTTVEKTTESITDPVDSNEIAHVTEDATIAFTNTRKTVEVTVIKKVDGTTGTFSFTALLQNGTTAITAYKIGVNSEGGNIITETGVAPGTVAGQAGFSLTPDNESKTATQILTVPYGADLTVDEIGVDGYSTMIKVGNKDAVASLTTGKIEDITEATTITFTNTEVIVAPTGVKDDKLPFIFMALLALIILLVEIRLPRKKEQDWSDYME